ncbi:MAG TPA: hypothetical protein VF522_12755, partial [Ramlibacter sp.]
MNKLAIALTTAFLASQAMAQSSLSIGGNVDAGAAVGGAVRGTTQAIGAAGTAVQGTAGSATTGVQATVPAPRVEAGVDANAGADAKAG